MRAEQVCLAARWRRPRSDPEHTERRSDTGQAAEKCSGAVNSAVECHLHTVEAAGSIPAPPTARATLAGRPSTPPHSSQKKTIKTKKTTEDHPGPGRTPAHTPSPIKP